MAGHEKTLHDHVEDLRAGGIRCNCDLDKWEPERDTGHSLVCRIHKAATQRLAQCPIRRKRLHAEHMVRDRAQAEKRKQYQARRHAASKVIEGVYRGTHVIVPVEPTEADVERACRAFCKAEMGDPDATYYRGSRPSTKWWEHYKDVVRAAIEAFTAREGE